MVLPRAKITALASVTPWMPKFNASTKKVYKCTLCSDRVGQGLEPACIKACPTGCLHFGTKDEMKTLAETRAALRATHERMLQTIERMAEANLFEPYSYYQPDAEGENSGNPVIGWIVGNGSEHYREHLGWMRAIAAGGPPTPTG